MVFMKLEYFEMETSFTLLAAITDDSKQKSHRTAVRIPAFSNSEAVTKALRQMADDIERKFS